MILTSGKGYSFLIYIEEFCIAGPGRHLFRTELDAQERIRRGYKVLAPKELGVWQN